ncbi:secondary thiamine-phosphate synthase enzyme YjbQ [Candidatus Neomarinimicrobiota bacterium]
MHTITITTLRQVEFIEITDDVRTWLLDQHVQSGLLTAYVPHTTAGITINENADPDVIRDLAMEINRVIPYENGYQHREGNAAAHIKAAILGSSIQVIIEDNDLVLGRWQGIFLGEFDGPRHQRQVHLQITPSS